MTDTSHLIDELLAERRPDRYEVQGGDEWLDDIADEIEGLIPNAREIAARMLVRRRETQKTRSTNRLLREIHESGAFPLDWFDLLNLPIVVGKERVALRAATAEDFRQFATEERRRAANDFAARNSACEGAEWIAEFMEANGHKNGRTITGEAA